VTFEIDRAEQRIVSVPEAEAAKAADHLRAFYSAARTAGVQAEYLCKITALLAWNVEYPNDIATAALRLSEEETQAFRATSASEEALKRTAPSPPR
jgi:hypothetical protein